MQVLWLKELLNELPDDMEIQILMDGGWPFEIEKKVTINSKGLHLSLKPKWEDT